MEGEVHNHVCTLSQVSARTGAGYGDISRVLVDLPNGPRELCAEVYLYFCMHTECLTLHLYTLQSSSSMG